MHFSTFRKSSDHCLPSWCRTRRCCCGTLRTEAAAIALSRICRLQLCFLTRRNEVRMLLEVLNDLFANDLSFEPAKGRLDRFVIINYYSCHFVFSPPFRQKVYRARPDFAPLLKGKQILKRVSRLSGKFARPKTTILAWQATVSAGAAKAVLCKRNIPNRRLHRPTLPCCRTLSSGSLVHS